jgi:hypothetical protein
LLRALPALFFNRTQSLRSSGFELGAVGAH